MNKIKTKVSRNTFMINGNSEEDDKKRETIKSILINEENKNKSDLHNYFLNNRDEAIFKHLPYFDIYESHFSKYRGKDINLLEIGVGYGGSLKMWKNYFSKLNPKAKVNIYGIDIKERCKKFEGDGIKIFIGSQSDRNFLKELKKEIPKLDILIDDGGHIPTEQIITFEEMFEHIKDGGLYFCEDIYTSYWANLSGNFKTSFIEYTKKLIDYLNAYWTLEGDDLEANSFTESAYSIHYYEGIVAIEKKLRDKRYIDICQQASIGKLNKL
ncbi:class I SAM-dependent methyltransferase [Brachyspira sp.]|uniref:class I SAM-dependent methyltransferase n=1 Tax=Brachyspira sp. TaxID=1977261 RepID=UPI003D7E07C8